MLSGHQIHNHRDAQHARLEFAANETLGLLLPIASQGHILCNIFDDGAEISMKSLFAIDGPLYDMRSGNKESQRETERQAATQNALSPVIV